MDDRVRGGKPKTFSLTAEEMYILDYEADAVAEASGARRNRSQALRMILHDYYRRLSGQDPETVAYRAAYLDGYRQAYHEAKARAAEG